MIHWLKPQLLLSATCDRILSWMIEVWMKHHLASDSNCNTTQFYNHPKKLQAMTNNVGLTFSVGDTTLWFTISIGQEN
jgi:hypothetical protein